MSARLSLVTALGVAALAGTAIGGDLNPPAGGVAPSMTTLSHIEPRICINDLAGGPDSVHTIAHGGQYYMRADVVAGAGKNGLTIRFDPGVPTTDRVLIHTNGFDITGEPGSLDGINYISLQPLGGDIVIHGGDSVIRGMGGDCIRIQGSREAVVVGFTLRDSTGDACDISLCSRVRVGLAIEKERRSGGFRTSVANTDSHGIVVSDCDDVSIAGLDVSGCGGDGVRVENSGFIRIRDTDSNRNDGDGFRFVNVTAQAQDAAEKADMGAIRASNNGGDGVHLEEVGDISLVDVEATGSGGDGIEVLRTRPNLTIGWILWTDPRCSRNAGDGIRLVFSEDISFGAGMGGARCVGNGGSGLRVEWAAAGPGGGGGGGGGGAAIRLTDSIFDDNIGDGVTLNRDRSKSLDLRIDECSLSSNGGNGFNSYFATGDRPTQDQFATMLDSTLRRNGNDGLFSDDMNLTVSSSEASGNHRDGWNVICVDAHSVFIGAGARSNGRHGEYVGGGLLTMRDCTSSGNGFTDPFTPGDGLSVSGATSITIAGSDFSSNAARGIAAADMTGDGRLDVVVCNGNGASGVVFESFIGTPCGRAALRQCISSGNGGHGLDIQCSSGAEVRECVMRGNGGLGTSASGTGHVFVWNTMADNAMGPFVIPVPGNSVGPALEEAFMATDEKPHSNYVR